MAGRQTVGTETVEPTVLPTIVEPTEVPVAVRITREEKIEGAISDYEDVISSAEKANGIEAGMLSGLIRASLSRLNDQQLDQVLDNEIRPGSTRGKDPSFLERITGNAIDPKHNEGVEDDPKGDRRYGLAQVQIRQAAAVGTEGREVNAEVRHFYGAIRRDLLDPATSINTLGETFRDNRGLYEGNRHGRSDYDVNAFAAARTLSDRERGREIGEAQEAAAFQASLGWSDAAKSGLTPEQAKYNWEATAAELRKTNPRLVDAVNAIVVKPEEPEK